MDEEEDSQSASAADVDWTSAIPDEILELVLSARLVCRRWRRVLSGRALWRRVRVTVSVGHERDACRVLRAVPALAALRSLALFPEDRVPTRYADLVLDAVRDAARAGLQVHSLSMDWRHFATDASSRACFHGILGELRHGVRHLDVGLIGVQPVEEGASAVLPQPTPALAALAALPALTSLRLRALFDPCWYFDEVRASEHAGTLRTLDASGCEPYLARLLGDLLTAHGPHLEALRITSRGLASAVAAAKVLHLPALRRLDVDLGHQDAALALPEAVRNHLVRLTIARMNRRLPTPDKDQPSEAVHSLGQRPWPSLRTLVLEDCLLSPADLSAVLNGIGRGLDRLVFLGGCFLGDSDELEALAGVHTGTCRTCLSSRGLRLCPRDQATGLYALAIEP